MMDTEKHIRNVEYVVVMAILAVMLGVAAAYATWGTSNVDNTVPATAAPSASTPIRGNFSIIKSEISALQGKIPATSTSNGLATFADGAGALASRAHCTQASTGPLSCVVNESIPVLTLTQNGTGHVADLFDATGNGLTVYGNGGYVGVTSASASNAAFTVTQTDASQRAFGAATGTGSTGDMVLTLYGLASTPSGLCLKTFADGDDPMSCEFHGRTQNSSAAWSIVKSIATTANSTYLIEAKVMGHEVGGTDSLFFHFNCFVRDVSGTTSILELNPLGEYKSTGVNAADYDCAGGSGTASIRVYGVAGKTITWQGDVNIFGPLGS